VRPGWVKSASCRDVFSRPFEVLRGGSRGTKMANLFSRQLEDSMKDAQGINFGRSKDFGTSRSVGEGTQGDDPTSPAGRRKMQREQAQRYPRENQPEEMDGTTSVPDYQQKTAKVKKRTKRTGYAQADRSSDVFWQDMDGKTNSERKRSANRIDPFYHRPNPAGRKTDVTYGFYSRLNGDADGTATKKSIYAPSYATDPITHSAKGGALSLDDAIVVAGRDTSLGKFDGPAGVDTQTLTQRSGTWFHRPPCSRGETPKISKLTTTGDGENPQPPRKPMKSNGCYQQNAYQDTVTIQHRTKPEPLPAEDLDRVRRNRNVKSEEGKYIYMCAGHEDLLPAATAPYTKADKPPSKAHREENDKRLLAPCYRGGQEGPVKGGRARSKCLESKDMAYIFGTDLEGTNKESGKEKGRRPNRRPASNRLQEPRPASVRSAPSDGGRGGYTPSERSLTQSARFSPADRRSLDGGSAYSGDGESRGGRSDPALRQLEIGVPIAV